MTFGEVLIRFGADIGPFQAGLAAMGGESASLGSTIARNMAIAGVAIVAAAIVTGIAAVKMAGDFQQGIVKLGTTAGELQSNLQMVGQGILTMSSQVGTGAQQLVQAMYWIESSGLHGAAALEALRVAAQAAKAENANLVPVSIALGAALNAYAGKGMTAIQVMNTLTAATGQGMMTFEQLSSALSSVLPASAKFGISLVDVTAALATMTAQGDPAAQAATHLRQVILALEAPSKIGAAALKSVGLTSEQVANEMKISLPDALKMITDAVGKKFPEGSAAYNQAIKNIAGGSKQMMGFLELTGSHMQTFASNVDKISSAVQKGGNNLMGWSEVQGTFNFKMDQAKAASEAFMIVLGTALLPILTQIVGAITPAIAGFTSWMVSSGALNGAVSALLGGLTQLIGFITKVVTVGAAVVGFFQHNAVAAAALGVAVGALGGVLALFAAASIARTILSLLAYGVSTAQAAASTLTMASTVITTFPEMAAAIMSSMGPAIASIAAIAGPFLLVGAIIALVVIAAIIIIQHWGAISAWLKAAWENTLNWLRGAFSAVGAWLAPVIAWFEKWKVPIIAVASVITAFLLPALIRVGVQAAIAGAQMLATFVSSLVRAGAAAVAAGAQATASFIVMLVRMGAQALATAAIMTGRMVVAIAGFVVQSIVAAATAIPAMIAGFVSWAIAGWAAAAATIAATWPILLIIAGIALLVVGIILLVQHWGQVVSFMRGVWQAFASWFMAMLSAVGTFFAGVWNGIVSVTMTVVNAVVGFFVGMWNRLQPVINIIKIALLVMFAPAIIAIALIVGPILGLILLITHFGQVTTALRGFLSAAWAGIVSVFTVAFNTIGSWFTWLYNHNTYIKALCDIIRVLFTVVISWLTGAWGKSVTGIATLWNSLVGIATTAFNAVKSVVMAIVSAITAWLTGSWTTSTNWLSNLWNSITGLATTAWNAVTTVITNLVTTIVNWLKSFWASGVSGLVAIWNTLSGLASAAFNAVMSVITPIVQAILAFLSGRWGDMQTLTATAMNALAGIATTAWNAVVAAFAAAWGQISAVLGTLMSNIGNWFTNLAAQAVQWGVALIQGLINGITSMVGAVGNAVGNIAHNIAGFLGFHSPTREGPGRELDSWGPALASGFAKGIISGLPMVQDAMNRLMLPVSGGMSGAASSASAAGAGVGRGGHGDTHVQIIIDGQQLSNIIAPKVATRIVSVGRSTGPISGRH